MKWFAAAAAFLAASMLVGAQQQTPNLRAGWPCGARLDPSYFRVAEGSGGHLLLLAPEEIDFAPAEGTTFAAVPSPGVENALRIRMSGHAFDLRASLVNGALRQLADLPLAAGDTEGLYVSRFTPGAEAFRVLVTGKDADGFPFQRMSAPLITPMR